MIISVIVPVGPDPVYKVYLDECIESIQKQSGVLKEIILIDDAAHVIHKSDWRYPMQVLRNPWRLGQAASLNIGIASATSDLIYVMGGCDDILRPLCLFECYTEYLRQSDDMGLYFPALVTSEGVESSLPQGTYLFHRDLWKLVGGYPPEAGVGEVDAVFQNLVQTIFKVVSYPVHPEEPLYWHREHPTSLTAKKLQSPRRREICKSVRMLCAEDWEIPHWTVGYEVD